MVVLLAACNRGGLPRGVNVLDPGEGPENVEPLMPLTAGMVWTTGGDIIDVRSSRAWLGEAIERDGDTLLRVESTQRFGNAETWFSVDDDGVWVEGSPVDGRFDRPVLWVPTTVRLGMSWEVEVADQARVLTVVSREQRDTALGNTTLWTIERSFDGTVVNSTTYAEGWGPFGFNGVELQSPTLIVPLDPPELPVNAEPELINVDTSQMVEPTALDWFSWVQNGTITGLGHTQYTGTDTLGSRVYDSRPIAIADAPELEPYTPPNWFDVYNCTGSYCFRPDPSAWELKEGLDEDWMFRNTPGYVFPAGPELPDTFAYTTGGSFTLRNGSPLGITHHFRTWSAYPPSPGATVRVAGAVPDLTDTTLQSSPVPDTPPAVVSMSQVSPSSHAAWFQSFSTSSGGRSTDPEVWLADDPTLVSPLIRPVSASLVASSSGHTYRYFQAHVGGEVDEVRVSEEGVSIERLARLNMPESWYLRAVATDGGGVLRGVTWTDALPSEPSLGEGRILSATLPTSGTPVTYADTLNVSWHDYDAEVCWTGSGTADGDWTLGGVEPAAMLATRPGCTLLVRDWANSWPAADYSDGPPLEVGRIDGSVSHIGPFRAVSPPTQNRILLPSGRIGWLADGGLIDSELSWSPGLTLARGLPRQVDSSGLGGPDGAGAGYWMVDKQADSDGVAIFLATPRAVKMPWSGDQLIYAGVLATGGLIAELGIDEWVLVDANGTTPVTVPSDVVNPNVDLSTESRFCWTDGHWSTGFELVCATPSGTELGRIPLPDNLGGMWTLVGSDHAINLTPPSGEPVQLYDLETMTASDYPGPVPDTTQLRGRTPDGRAWGEATFSDGTEGIVFFDVSGATRVDPAVWADLQTTPFSTSSGERDYRLDGQFLYELWYRGMPGRDDGHVRRFPLDQLPEVALE